MNAHLPEPAPPGHCSTTPKAPARAAHLSRFPTRRRVRQCLRGDDSRAACASGPRQHPAASRCVSSGIWHEPRAHNMRDAQLVRPGQRDCVGCALSADTADEVLQPQCRALPVLVQPGAGTAGGPVAHVLAQVIQLREQRGRRFPVGCRAPRAAMSWHRNAPGKGNLANKEDGQAGAGVARGQR